MTLLMSATHQNYGLAWLRAYSDIEPPAFFICVCPVLSGDYSLQADPPGTSAINLLKKSRQIWPALWLLCSDLQFMIQSNNRMESEKAISFPSWQLIVGSNIFPVWPSGRMGNAAINVGKTVVFIKSVDSFVKIGLLCQFNCPNVTICSDFSKHSLFKRAWIWKK